VKKLLTFSLVLSLVVTFGIANIGLAQENQSPSDVMKDQVYGGTIHLARTQAPEGMFNPLFHQGTYDADLASLVFEGLTTVDNQFRPKPELAVDWEVSNDNKTYTFYLDEDAKFHDGHPVTAEDVKYTFKMFLHPDYTGVRTSDFTPILGAEAYHNGNADDVKGIKVIDDYTIEISTDEVFAPFLSVTCSYGIVPKHILGDTKPANLSKLDFNQNPIGSGPFEFVEYKTDQYAKLKAYDDYREGRPFLDNVVIHYINAQTLVMQLEKGEVDWGQIRGSNFNRVNKMDHISLHQQIRNGFGYIAFNTREENFPVNIPHVRRAIAYGVNRTGFQKEVMNGMANNVNSPISQASWAYTDDLNQYPYNPEKAKQILKDNGWQMKDGVWHKDGKPLSFTLTGSSGNKFINQLLAMAQNNLNNIGMDVKLQKLEFNSMREKINNGELKSWFMAWTLGSDPDPYSMFHTEGSWNRTGWGSEETDQIIEKARTTLDQRKREKLYEDFQKKWNKTMPYLPMYANIYAHAVNKRIRNYDPRPGAMNPFHSWDVLTDVWIPKDERRQNQTQ